MSETTKRAAIGLLIVACAIVAFFTWATITYGWDEINFLPGI